ncbi:Rha family phage protein [Trabulsiella guamensis ATCC 49490]|uniref:Rha family phage protein n=1 Tax=Trabulsiella guamensis ATCC 49490 TaxID=1005994 RepID=A0A085ADJ2_9ENTR|nr:BRO family protein [Trabulsiella guamensis]KFC08287.1 Rha family phage protein [Trabulsiella guamensis ATCC 49490]
MATALAFHNTRFNVVNRNNQIWLSSKELAQALKYASTKAVTDIYNKNTDEFSDGMSQVVESTTSGNYRKKVRIFSLRGAHLIAMFARTPVAKEFRRWVLDILDREVGEPVTKPVPASPTHRHNSPTFRYIITLTYKDVVTGQEETFRGGANTPGEIIQGTAKRFGIFVSEMITMPVGAYY